MREVPLYPRAYSRARIRTVPRGVLLASLGTLLVMHGVEVLGRSPSRGGCYVSLLGTRAALPRAGKSTELLKVSPRGGERGARARIQV